jgi:hypothetical protein
MTELAGELAAPGFRGWAAEPRAGASGQLWRFSKMPAAPWPPPTHMVTMP